MIGVSAAQVRPIGQSEVTSTATTSLTFPDRVFTASIVAVGGGGGGSTTGGSGGAGGAGGNLAYRDNTAITPGLAYSITIGAGGARGGTTGTAGGNTQWNASVLVAPGGGGARSGVLGGLAGASGYDCLRKYGVENLWFRFWSCGYLATRKRYLLGCGKRMVSTF